jgi:hypothetical protein
MAIERFARGFMLTSNMPEGHFIYVVLVRFNRNGAVASGTYARYPNPVPRQ